MEVVLVGYTKDYIDRYAEVPKLVAPDGFEHVLLNVPISGSSSNISYLDLAYVKQGKIVGISDINYKLNGVPNIMKGLAIRLVSAGSAILTNNNEVSFPRTPTSYFSMHKATINKP